MKIQRRTKDGWEDRASFDETVKPEEKPDIVDKASKRWRKYWAQRQQRLDKLTDSKLKEAAKLNSL